MNRMMSLERKRILNKYNQPDIIDKRDEEK
jgi:hypothetical protein